MTNIAAVAEQIKTVEFHGQELMLVEHEGQPFAPMRPIVEGMGLGWSPQRRKLSQNAERWGVIKMITPSDGGGQDMVCMPVRKLPAFMATISPNKVRADLRESVSRYQNECDDALWAYWTKGAAINPRIPLTPEQQRCLQELVAERAGEVDEANRGRAFPALWGKLKSKFRVGTYKDIPQVLFDEACEFIKHAPLEGEWISVRSRPAPDEPTYRAAAREFALDYFERCRHAVQTGGPVPQWDYETEQKLADAICADVIDGKRWLLTFEGEGNTPTMRALPRDTMMLRVTSEQHLKDLMRELVPSGLLPELMQIALGRLSYLANKAIPQAA